MLYCDPLSQEGLVGGGNEIPRNEQQNHLRIERLDSMFKGKDKSKINILDFGSGHNLFVDDLVKHGYNAFGYDAYNEQYSRLPPNNFFDAITCVEVIEHTSYPFPEIEVMYRSLRKNGFIYFESSYVDVAEQEQIPLEDFEYISPQAGHSSIFSFHAIDLLMVGRRFKVGRHFNRHTKLYYKS